LNLCFLDLWNASGIFEKACIPYTHSCNSRPTSQSFEQLTVDTHARCACQQCCISLSRIIIIMSASGDTTSRASWDHWEAPLSPKESPRQEIVDVPNAALEAERPSMPRLKPDLFLLFCRLLNALAIFCSLTVIVSNVSLLFAQLQEIPLSEIVVRFYTLLFCMIVILVECEVSFILGGMKFLRTWFGRGQFQVL